MNVVRYCIAPEFDHPDREQEKTMVLLSSDILGWIVDSCNNYIVMVMDQSWKRCSWIGNRGFRLEPDRKLTAMLHRDYNDYLLQNATESEALRLML